MAERRSSPRRDGRPNRAPGSRPSGPSRGPRKGPRRDDDRPARPRRDDDDRPARPRRDDDDRPRRPRRDDDRPRRPRRDDDRPARPRRDDDRPRRPRRDDDDRPRRPRRDDDRPARPRRDDDDRPRRPRRDDDRPARPRRDDDRPRRPRRDEDDRPRRPRRDDDRPARPRRDDDDRPRRPRRDDDRPRRPRRDDDRPRRPRRDDDDRPRRPRRDDDRPRRPRTAAEERSAEVRRKTGGRRTSSTSFVPPVRTRDEEWIDEGPVRPRRGGEGGPSRPSRSSRSQKVQALPEAVIEFERAVGARQAARYVRHYESALEAFESQRYAEARTQLVSLARECGDVGVVHELLGLCLYREGSWQKAIVSLEAAQKFRRGKVFNHAVLADCYRAIGNFNRVRELWEEMKEASPHAELLAEGRIVFAGSLADQGRYSDALTVMEKVSLRPRKVLEYHLRQWYVIADLHDRLGNPVKARQVFETIMEIDPKFSDVAERLSSLGG